MKKSAAALLLLSLIGSAQQPLWAESYKGRTEVGVRVGGLITEGNSALDDDWVYGGQIGYNLTHHWGIEAAILAGNTELRVPSTGNSVINSNTPQADIDVILPSLDVLYHFTRNRFRPYVSVGLADIHTKGSSDSRSYGYSSSKNDDLGLQYGFGFKWLMCEHGMLRVDLKHLLNTEYNYQRLGKSENNALLTAGLSWLFGRGDESKPAATTPAAAPTPPAPLDSDRDGVIDANDACPGTPAGSNVDARGCTLSSDSDQDGISDAKDECPNTPAGTKVDSTGCPQSVRGVEDNWTLQGVQFATGSDDIKPSSFATLNEAANVLKTRSRVRVEIQGHTDNVGGVEANNTLSERRAKAVKNYLVKQGVPADNMETKGYGSSSPVGDNTTALGRAKNRRIDFKVLSR